jgi:hypothetical protein
MTHKIAIIKYKDLSGTIRYRAYTHPNPSATAVEIIDLLFWTLGYQQEYPNDNTIYEGKLHETSIRPCVLTTLEREQGVRICLKEDGSIVTNYPVGSDGPMPQDIAYIQTVHHTFLDA